MLSNPFRLLPVSFAAMIGIGTSLLLLPQATVSGRKTTLLDALFTATSAVCVTGLAVVDTATHWTGFGKAINVAVLTAILTYHVVSGKVMSTDVMAGDVPSVEGSTITLGTTDGVQVNDATVVSADIETSNGVIHAIDKVLVPSTVDLASL